MSIIIRRKVQYVRVTVESSTWRIDYYESKNHLKKSSFWVSNAALATWPAYSRNIGCLTRFAGAFLFDVSF